MLPDSISCIVLAAGSSSRLGRPKQLVKLSGRSLLQNTLDVASKISKTVAVLGANEAAILEDLSLPDQCICIINKEWESGMSSSIRSGVTEAMKWNPEAIMILLCDQPFVTEDLLHQMISWYKECDKGIVACTYNGNLGVPALFKAKYYDDLLKLSGQEGARKFIYAHREDVATVDFPLGTIDVDTEEDILKAVEIMNKGKEE